MGEADRIDLNEMARGLDLSKLAEVADFIGYLKVKQEREVGPGMTPEDKAWLGADLSRLGEYEAPLVDEDPEEGDPIRWDAERNAFVAGG